MQQDPEGRRSALERLSQKWMGQRIQPFADSLVVPSVGELNAGVNANFGEDRA
jgi:hypothetical protein